MNLVDTEERLWVWCHICEKHLEMGELVKKGEELKCLICGERLGFMWDLPEGTRRFYEG